MIKGPRHRTGIAGDVSEARHVNKDGIKSTFSFELAIQDDEDLTLHDWDVQYNGGWEEKPVVYTQANSHLLKDGDHQRGTRNIDHVQLDQIEKWGGF